MAGDDTYFPEYDPTPYGGGYDPEDVYGKSTAPSEKSCYPPHRDADDITDLSSVRDGDDDNHSVISAYGVELPDDFYKSPEIAKPKPSNPRTVHPENSPNPRTVHPENSSNNNHPANDESARQQEPQSNDGQWKSEFDPPYFNYDAPMNYYSFDLFSYNAPQEEEQGSSYEPTSYEPTEDISEKVARWLFSSTHIWL